MRISLRGLESDMGDNRSHGKIDALPDVLKKQVEEKLLAGET